MKLHLTRTYCRQGVERHCQETLHCKRQMVARPSTYGTEAPCLRPGTSSCTETGQGSPLPQYAGPSPPQLYGQMAAGYPLPPMHSPQLNCTIHCQAFGHGEWACPSCSRSRMLAEPGDQGRLPCSELVWSSCDCSFSHTAFCLPNVLTAVHLRQRSRSLTYVVVMPNGITTKYALLAHFSIYHTPAACALTAMATAPC